MRRNSRAFIVCAPHARVGTTMTARLLMDWLLSGPAPAVMGFDTDPLEAPFAGRFPDLVEVADISSIQGQMAIFDRLLDAGDATCVVDVWNRSFLPFFEIVRTISFFREAEARGVSPCIVYHADESDLALQTAHELTALWPDVDLLIVHNAGAAAMVEDAAAVLDAYPGGRALLVPELDPYLRRVIEEPGFSFSTFLNAPPQNMSIVVRAALRNWLMRIFDQISSFELRMAMRGAEYLR